MSVNKPKAVAGITIPDSTIAKQATELLLEHGTEFIYNHSLRVFVFASLNGANRKLRYDPELLYVSAVFHDLGLTPHYSSADKRFEVDGANAARDFLKGHGLPPSSLQLVWDTIALHTTIGVAEYKEAEVALLYSGVGLDVMGEGYQELTEENREAIIKQFPRNGFKKNIIPTFFDGFKHKTDTTFGNIKADVCAFMIPGFQRKNFCDCILQSPWSE
ncbi:MULTISPECIES: HD domain-containing protein [Niastella]|uniref:HD domain-containing protein n=1 Tax=Niastella soli TaxID=2821487 RepID=A0ABS3YW79_9BACT|nr:HD domain-containing protein [Niastella soli]MBO9202184.1 HD domain-containing protein [Niastella soli]